MTACLRQLGVRSSFGVDYVKHKQVTAPVSLADLTTRAGQELLWQWLENPNVVGVFLAPPCGSASRARAIRLHHKSHCKHHQGPRPLRSDDHPNGLPHLAWTDKERIAKANILYRLTADVVRWAAAQRIPVVVENPQYSFFWNTTFWTEVSNLMSNTTFHSCQYGSLRQKRTMTRQMGHQQPDLKICNCRGDSLPNGAGQGFCCLLHYRPRKPRLAHASGDLGTRN